MDKKVGNDRTMNKDKLMNILMILMMVSILSLLNIANGFGLRMVREGNLLIYYNEKELKVKAYYYIDNQKVYTYRYYYNIQDGLVKKEIWKKSILISYYSYEYYGNTKKIKRISYYIADKLKMELRYNPMGKLIHVEKNF